MFKKKKRKIIFDFYCGKRRVNNLPVRSPKNSRISSSKNNVSKTVSVPLCPVAFLERCVEILRDSTLHARCIKN